MKKQREDQRSGGLLPYGWVLLTLLAIGGVAPASAATRSPMLQRYSSEHYDIHTNLTKAETEMIGRHMDTVFEEYTRRFKRAGLQRIRHGRMPLYVLRKQKEYLAFLRSAGLKGENTSGLFFIQPNIRGLATWTQGRSLTETFSVLQHEGFHQFAAAHFRTPLPIWMNEGLAEYFEDAILVNGHMKAGIANGRRITSVKNAIRAGRTASMQQLLKLRDEQWLADVRSRPERARLMYDQAWSVVHFLVHLPTRGHGSPFDQYLQELSRGTPHQDAWRDAFGRVDVNRLESAWKLHVLKLRPDPLHTALTNMEFLASAMRYLVERGKPVPRSLGALRKRMQGIGFASVRRLHGYTLKISALDETVYQYASSSHVPRSFVMLEPTRRDLPPRITAPGLKPEPTLVWLRDATGELTTHVEFR